MIAAHGAKGKPVSRKALELGISAIQQSSLSEGARLIRIAVRSADLTPDVRAIACIWLAETAPDTAHKRACYTAALQAEPGNADARARLNALLTAGLPSAPAATAYAAPTATGTYTPAPTATGTFSAVQPATSFNVADYLVRVIDGPNGAGTAVYVTADGLLATTRRVIGGLEQVTLETYAGGQTRGTVIRSYADLDLALIRVDARPAALLPVTPLPRVPDDAALTIVSYDGEVTRATQRPTRRSMAPHWIPTSVTALSDAGGAVIFDERNYLVGIMTRCTSLASSVTLYGLHITAIRRLAETALAELRGERRRYCPDCGTASRATGQGYFYCEQCGAAAPEARSVRRYPVPQAAQFYEPVGRPRCPVCNATVGAHGGRCLRCGGDQR